MNNKHIAIEEFRNTYADIILLIYFIDSCNYNCSYCYNRRPYTHQRIDINKLFTFIEILSENLTKKIAIEIIGGEPTLHPQLVEFIQKVQLLPIVDICIFTNFSQKTDFYTDLIDKFNVRFLATWHSLPYDLSNYSFVNKMLSVDKKYFSKCNNIGFRSLFVRIMLEQKTFDYSCSLYKKIISLYPENVDVSLVADPSLSHDKNNINENNTNYSDDQKRTYKELYSLCNSQSKKQYKVVFTDKSVSYYSFGEMFLNKFFQYYLYKCNAGNDYFYIHCDGNIFPCQSYYEMNQRPLFNIHSDLSNFKKEKYTICKSKVCSCDFGIKKQRIFK